jgi:hypothetical protein
MAEWSEDHGVAVDSLNFGLINGLWLSWRPGRALRWKGGRGIAGWAGQGVVCRKSTPPRL